MSYKDTVNHFSINIPIGWQYGLSKNFPKLKLLSYRTPSNQLDTSRDNFNINIVETPGKTLDSTFPTFLKYISNSKDFKIIKLGDTTLNGRTYKWLIETHKIENNGIQMHNYDFVTLKDGKTYILTMATFSSYFDVVRPLFDKIANSFLLLD